MPEAITTIDVDQLLCERTVSKEVVHCVGYGNMAARMLRHMVAKSRKRFQEDGFDLDLAYVTDRIIAMSLPCEGSESYFRNPLSDVKIFINKYHAKHAKVFNLCLERCYPNQKLGTEYAYYPLEDLQPPPFDITIKFCHEAEQWLNQHPQNVIIVHCRAGKGRTGSIICALLQYLKIASCAKDAIEIFDNARMVTGTGITLASQRRFLKYFEEILLRNQDDDISVCDSNDVDEDFRVKSATTILDINDIDLNNINNLNLNVDFNKKNHINNSIMDVLPKPVNFADISDLFRYFYRQNQTMGKNLSDSSTTSQQQSNIQLNYNFHSNCSSMVVHEIRISNLDIHALSRLNLIVSERINGNLKTTPKAIALAPSIDEWEVVKLSFRCDAQNARMLSGDQCVFEWNEEGELGLVIRPQKFSQKWIFKEDVKFHLFTGSTYSTKQKSLCYFWLNTEFVPKNGKISLQKDDLDKLRKEIGSKIKIDLVYEIQNLLD